MNTKMVNNTLHNRVLLFQAVDTVKGDVNLTCKNVYLDLSFIKFILKKKEEKISSHDYFINYCKLKLKRVHLCRLK